ncbi:sugar transferase [Paraclostridium sordellii]|uniref:sugar transferase n=1 Tax=Paraclostridium sordellii TaxID=1505 RepID=UPI0005E00295|nr:sugar transferase [Paeniclostridium sordellii]CEP81817.1 galactosyl transferase CpsE [[Clostridium] sordellii] [Paeniclostridium sordellii]
MYKIIKRSIDILLSLTILPLFIVLLIPISIAIKLEDGGPIFFCGERVGKNRKVYKMYKFRTMEVNAEDLRNEDGSTFNSENDPRVTKIGRLLRKTSIDEVPQILNVIIGDMSFIGPRPSPCGNEHLYSEWYLKKFDVLPGLTGYNQAYCRNSATLDVKQKNDIFYVDNISFMMDIRIFFKTIVTVIKKDGIYTNDDKKHIDFKDIIDEEINDNKSYEETLT